MSLSYWIDPAVFDRFPGYRRGVVLAHGVRNGDSPPELIAELRTAEAGLSQRLTLEQVTTHPQIAAWREAYRALGIKPADFRPSMEALARRVLRNDPLPAINTLVDLGNLVSIRRLIPAGAHAIDVLAQDICLRPATGAEIFEPFGADVIEHPLPGEFVFVEGDTVLTRRWTWRQAKHTLVTPETTAVEINIDGLPPVTTEEVDATCQEMAGLVQKYCGGQVRYEILSHDHPRMDLSS